MDPNIAGTPDYSIFSTPESDIKKKGKFLRFNPQKDSILPSESNNIKSMIEANIPDLNSGDLHSGSLLEISSTKFAYLVIQPILLKIEILAGDLIVKLGNPNETNMILLELLKKISEAIKSLEQQIQEAGKLDAKTVRKILKNIIDKAEAILDEIKKVRDKINKLNKEMNDMEKASKKGKGILGIFNSVKRGFRNLKERFSKKNRLARRAGRKVNRKARRAARKARRTERKGMDRKQRRGARRARRQKRRQRIRDAGGPLKLIFSTVKGAIVGIFQGKGIGEIVNNLINRLKELLKLFFGIGLDVQRLRSYSLISLMIVSTVHLEISKGSEQVKGISEEEQQKLDEENQERKREELRLIINNYTSDEEIRGVMGDQNCKQLESDEFIDALIFAANSSTGVEKDVSDETIMEFINAILEENENYIASLLKDLKMMRKLYNMVLAMLNGQVGGDFGQMAKDLKKILTAEEPIVSYMNQQV